MGFTCTTSGVVCQGEQSWWHVMSYSHHVLWFVLDINTTPFAPCSTGEIRIAMSSSNVSLHALEGRLELCINSAWGTVCDSLFGNEDAMVACGRVEGFLSGGKPVL